MKFIFMNSALFKSGVLKLFLCAFVSAGLIVGCGSDDPAERPEVVLDSDGDGILDEQEIANGTNKNNACDPVQNSGYSGYDDTSSVWLASDCDKDGVTNGDELAASTDPYVDEVTDSDGDGVVNSAEIAAGTDENDPCDPVQVEGYTGFNPLNSLWLASDCDSDGVLNSDELSNATDPYLDDTVYPIPEFLPNLSELLLFEGNLADLNLNSTVFEYDLSTRLFTDYAYKQRTISLPKGTTMSYDGAGLPTFPDGTILAKTFYYYNNEQNPAAGRQLIETRVLIKINGLWEMGNYLWNAAQDDAELSLAAPTIVVSWIDNVGASKTVNYQVPNMPNCIQCHDKSGLNIPIGPKLRSLNFVKDGVNPLENLISKGLLIGAPSILQIESLPEWSDNSLTLEERARAYMDMNCAHCHQPGGLHDSDVGVRPDFRYETTFADSNIDPFKLDIRNRVNTDPAFGVSMPLVGVSIKHDEAVQLIQDYIDSL